jgi:hypothetical protein
MGHARPGFKLRGTPMDRAGRSLRCGPSRLPDALDGRDRTGKRDSRRARRARAGAHAPVLHRPVAPVCSRRGRLCRPVSKPLRLSHLRDRLLETVGDQRDMSTGAVPAVARDTGLRVPLRILLAEDNPMNQKVALRLLERRGYAADVVGDGRQALAGSTIHLRRHTHGRPDAGDGWSRDEPRHLRALGCERASAHHRDDRRGNARGLRQVSGRSPGECLFSGCRKPRARTSN